MPASASFRLPLGSVLSASSAGCARVAGPQLQEGSTGGCWSKVEGSRNLAADLYHSGSTISNLNAVCRHRVPPLRATLTPCVLTPLRVRRNGEGRFWAGLRAWGGFLAISAHPARALCVQHPIFVPYPRPDQTSRCSARRLWQGGGLTFCLVLADLGLKGLNPHHTLTPKPHAYCFWALFLQAFCDAVTGAHKPSGAGDGDGGNELLC